MKTFLSKLVVAASLFVSATVPATATLIIKQNPGGVVMRFYEAVESYRMRGEKIIVDGACYSACTLVLALARDSLVCATPRASFHFHRPYSGPPGTPGYDDDGGLSELWMTEMPESVAEFIKSRGGLTHSWITLAGKEMQARVPMCSSGAVKAAGEPNVLRKKYS